MLKALAAMAAFFMPATALAADCAPIAKGHAILAGQYGEAPIGRGVQGGRLVMLYSSREGETWTVTVTDPVRGIMCIIAAGEGWEPMAYTAPGEPS